jgi:heptosyltransferase-2
VADAPSRVVVLAPNWLGDLIMALPAISSLRQWWPAARIAIAARESVAPIVRLVEGVDETVLLGARPSWTQALGSGAAEAALSAGTFDLAVVLPNSFHAALTVWRAGIPERWGYRTDFRARFLTRAARPPRTIHHAEYYMRLVTALGAPSMPLVASLRHDDEADARARRLLEDRGWGGDRFIVFAPGAAFGSAKRWPPERVGAVIAAVTREASLTPVIVGSAADRETAAEVTRVAMVSGVRDLIDLTGETDLPTLAAALARAAAVVSNDSGAMHIAAAVGVPVAGIFGPTNDQRTSPLPHPSHRPAAVIAGDAWCRPCELRRCPIDHRCMRSISVDRVTESVRALVGRGGATAPGQAA